MCIRDSFHHIVNRTSVFMRRDSILLELIWVWPMLASFDDPCSVLWTSSSNLERFRNFGNHTTCAYSRWGLTNVMYNWRKRSGVRWKKLLLIKPTIEFVFFTWLNICSSNDRSLSKITSKSFSLKTWSSTLFPSLYEWTCFMFSKYQHMTFSRVKPQNPSRCPSA